MPLAQQFRPSSYDLDCEKVAVIGTPAHEIREYAANAGADLIVIGSHRRHGLGLLQAPPPTVYFTINSYAENRLSSYNQRRTVCL